MRQHLIDSYNEASRSDKERIRRILWYRYETPLLLVQAWPEGLCDPAVEYSGYDMEAAKEALRNGGRIEGLEHSNIRWHLLEVDADGSQVNIIDRLDIPAINEATESILYTVQQYFGGKYTTHETEDGDPIKLRIADHSGKHRNNTYGEKCISIVVANNNVTEHFRSKGPEGIRDEYYYDDSYSVEDVISEIEQLLIEEGVIFQNA